MDFRLKISDCGLKISENCENRNHFPRISFRNESSFLKSEIGNLKSEIDLGGINYHQKLGFFPAEIAKFVGHP